MCGIAGVVRGDGAAVEARSVKGMTDVIAHRGPDAEGTWTEGGTGLGNRRLAIIDLTPEGNQPMTSEDGNTVLVYSGELYNHLELRKQLEAAGHRFRSRCDTEALLHAYEEWGDACVDRFNGHFAFAIWDRRRHRLLLARDRFGTRPLYWTFDGQNLRFASEVKSLLVDPVFRPALCLPALDEYFTFQNVISDRTLFAGVRLLPPGCMLAFEPHLGEEPVIHQYWDFRFPDRPDQMSMDDAADELYRLFEQAVTRQLMSDVPVGCYLSGGMDSGSIATVARRRLGRMMTFTGGFDLSSASGLELGFDERGAAEALSNVLKTEHYEIVMHAGDMEACMPELIEHLEDLRVGQSYPNFYMARLAGRFVKVVLSGAGGDELFAGYPWRYYRGLNSPDRSTYYRSYYNFWQRLVPDEDKGALFQPHVTQSLGEHSTFAVFRDVVERSGLPMETNDDFVNASLYFELKTFLHGLLVVEDKLGLAHSLETRTPFLDNDLVDFALRVPVSLKLADLGAGNRRVDEDDVRRYQERPATEGKLVLRRAMARMMPETITTRRKQGFSAPDASWFRGESIDYINRLLNDPGARINEYLSPAYVNDKLTEHAAGRVNHRLFIWSLLSFEWWLRIFAP